MTLTVDGKAIPEAERRRVNRIWRLLTRDRRGGPWPIPDWLPHEAFRFRGNGGADISARWFPAADAQGTVLLLHPDRRYAQHWFVNAGWIDALHARGYNALTFDFPHYGLSRGGGYYYLEDVLTAAEEAQRRTPHLPLHMIGLSLGAFGAANASPLVDVHGLVLESPYPSFGAWYKRGPLRWAVDALERAAPMTASFIHADQSLARTRARRILVAATRDDDVTPPRLTRQVADAGPADRTTYLEVDGVPHLELFAQSAAYRDAVWSTLAAATPSNGSRPGSKFRPVQHRLQVGEAPHPLA
jgi:pimeloyl-ACP methyl ester carboxylesterase